MEVWVVVWGEDGSWLAVHVRHGRVYFYWDVDLLPQV